MTTSPARRDTVLDSIPEPQIVRERLGQLVREASVLRALLRISVRVAKELEQRQKGRVSHEA